MKQISLFLLLITACILQLSAQSTKSTLPLKVSVEDIVQPFPANAKVQMTSKINQMLTANGLSSTDIYNNFVLTVIANPTDKVIVPGAPAKVMQSIDFTFYIVDANRQIIFSTYSTSAKGVGESDVKSYMDAMKRVNIKSPEVSTFLNQGRKKIVDWYEREARNIFAKVRMLANQHKYEEAFYDLCSFPTECSKYMESLNLGNEIYQDYLNYNAQTCLNQAKMAWAAEQNSDGAAKAGLFLAEIMPNTTCYKEAMTLYNEIKSKVLDDWKFEMKQYQDGIDLEKQRINAWKEVGVAYGKNQKTTTTNLSWLK